MKKQIISKAELLEEAQLPYSSLERFISTIIRLTEEGKTISISGFGTFECKTRAARTFKLNSSINSKSGQKSVFVPPRKLLTFKCSKQLKERLNSK